MKFLAQLPILQELFESDLVIFYALGLIAAFLSSRLLKNDKMLGIGAGAAAAVYLICEAIAIACSGYGVGIAVMVIGVLGLGGCLGFLIRLAVSRYRNS